MLGQRGGRAKKDNSSAVWGFVVHSEGDRAPGNCEKEHISVTMSSVYWVLGIKLKVLHMLSLHSTTELY